MNKDAVQHERGPRNSTIRRQVALYLKESGASVGPLGLNHPVLGHPSQSVPVCSPSISISAPGSLPISMGFLRPQMDINPSTIRPTAICHPTPKVRLAQLFD